MVMKRVRKKGLKDEVSEEGEERDGESEGE